MDAYIQFLCIMSGIALVFVAVVTMLWASWLKEREERISRKRRGFPVVNRAADQKENSD